MRFVETAVAGAYVVEQEPISDDRGYFARGWCAREFESHGLINHYVGINEQFNDRCGTLRGLHMQLPPHAEAKLVRCSQGAMFDVVVDARAESETFQRWFGTELSATNRLALYIPEGCLHGYLTLQDKTQAYYLVSAFYAPGSEFGARWDDPAFAIEWPTTDDLVISEKDRQWQDFKA